MRTKTMRHYFINYNILDTAATGMQTFTSANNAAARLHVALLSSDYSTTLDADMTDVSLYVHITCTNPPYWAPVGLAPETKEEVELMEQFIADLDSKVDSAHETPRKTNGGNN